MYLLPIANVSVHYRHNTYSVKNIITSSLTIIIPVVFNKQCFWALVNMEAK